MTKSAKEMFENIGWSYRYIKGDRSEDTIQCRDTTRTILLTPQEDFSKISPNIQFNLVSKLIVINDIRFIDTKLIKAINQQCKELGWLEDYIDTLKTESDSVEGLGICEYYTLLALEEVLSKYKETIGVKDEKVNC